MNKNKLTPTEFANLVEDIQKLIKKRNNINDKLRVLIPLRNENCPHSKTAIRNRHIPGSYLDRSECHTETYCTTCDKVLNDKVSYGFYG